MTAVVRFSLIAILVAFAALFAPRAAAAAQVNVSIQDNFFAPVSASVAAGDTVVWKNNGATSHTVTANDGSFDSGIIAPGATYSRTFSVSGTHPYRCTIHTGQNGAVTVVAASPAPSAAPPPPPSPTYSPAPAPSPSTVDELRARAQALLARIQQLQAQLGASVTPGASGTVTVNSSACPLIGRSLKRGSQGDDVTRLQQFLARDPSVYPEGQVTGYYGALTEGAVRRWQVKYNIVSSGTPETTGYGVVGPRTAAAIALQCSTQGGGGSGSPNVGGFIQVTPVSGNAPLNIAVQATVNTVNSCSGATYTLDYGDGSLANQIAVPAGNCQQMVQTLAHQYRYGGTYLVTLSAGGHKTSATVIVYGAGPPLPPVPSPGPSPSPTPGPTSTDSVSASPLSGEAPLSVKFTGVINGSASCGGGSYLLAFGDGQTTEIPYPADGCKAYTFELSHSYSSGGTFVAKLFEGTNTSAVPVAQTTVTVSGTSATQWGIISITPASGGNTLAVSAQVLSPACAAYSVDWGDGSTPTSTAAQSGCTGGTATANHSHTYGLSGSYTVSLRDSGGAVKATSGVSISN